MALIQTLISAAGPLPVETTFTAEGDGDVIFFVSGSAWSELPGNLIVVSLYLDGQPVGNISCYANEANSHKALVPAFFPVNLTPGEHQIGLWAAGNGVIADSNDILIVTLIY